MTINFVTKRDGNIEEFNVAKIKRMIDWSCEGLEVNSLALEAKFDEFLSEELCTKSIQENLIMAARMLANSDEPDWTFVAGRLWTMQMWKERNGYSQDLYSFINSQILKGEYYGSLVEALPNNYTKEEMDYLGSKIDKYKDLNHSYGSVLTAYYKYLTKTECLQEMFMVTSMIIASVSENKVAFAEELYTALSDRKLSLASPWLGNIRQGGNISSCFIIEPNDSIDSIFDNVKRAALISKDGGGLGISLARIRAQGSEVAGRKGASKGVFGWASILDKVAVFVDQGGKRAGAFTLALPVWHRDLEGFLEIQSETGDLRTKAFDIFPQVTVPNLLMELDKEDGNNTWYTFCPYEVNKAIGVSLPDLFGKDFEEGYKKAVEGYEQGIIQNVKKFKVRDVLKMIMRAQFDSGLPYIAFTDTINNDNPNDHVGNIPSVNLCIESFSVVKPDELAHSCNLASVVAGRCEDLDEVVRLAGLATEVLDNGIALTKNPVSIAGEHNSKLRTIGVGVQGMADWLAKNFTTYKDKQAISEFMEAVQYGAVCRSVLLAKERGAYPEFKGSRWDTGKQLSKYSENPRSKMNWKMLEPLLSQYGIRNSQLTSPAPNTSTSIFMDAGAGMMPTYGGFYQKDNGNGLFPFASMYVKENFLFYAKNASMYDVSELAEAVGVAQGWVDAGISTEYFMDHNKPDFTAKDLYELIHSCYDNRTKGIYYIRHIKKGKSFSDEVSIETVGCEGCRD